MIEDKFITHRGAVISDCEKYRYVLTRGYNMNYIPFVMLNPSTADAMEDDPTIRRCIGFARDWGYHGLVVLNLYAYRATDPKELKKLSIEVAIGENNEDYWRHYLRDQEKVVCGWGNNANKEVVERFWTFCLYHDVRTMCLGTTKSNQPKHPLYLKTDTQLVEWRYN